ncbi:MAG TPA: T9SS type A sorting domain-containing protein [Bacteroidia bacterium]
MSAFTFPVGNGSVNAPLSISSYNNRNSQDFFTAQYFDSRNSNAGGTKASGIDHVSQAEYWDLTRGSAGTASTQVIVSLSYNETTRSGQVDNVSQLLIAHWTGTQWENLGRSSGGSSGNATSGVTAASSRSTTYSPFTLGSSSTLNPLPIELLSFTAKANNSNVSLNWSTASELNNDFFSVEKSMDGINWTVIGKVNSIGNTEKITEYALIDANPVTGVQYYRLKQTDINGQFTYSQIVPVNFSGKVVNSVVIYPSPANNVLNLEVSASESGQTNITIYNALGTKVMELSGDQRFYSIDITSLDAGIYYIEVSQDGNTSKSKVLKY